MKYQKGMKLADTLPIATAKKETKTAGVGALEQLWWDLPLIFDDILKTTPLTMADRGQLKMFITKVGKRHVAIFSKVIRNWYPFCDYVRGTQDLKSSPELPQIGFILKYAGDAVNFEGAEKPVTLIAKPVMVKKVVPVSKAPAKSNKMTLDDLEEVHAELEVGHG